MIGDRVMVEKKRASGKTLSGTVISDKMEKTVTVEVRTMVMHPKYKKYIRRRMRYKAHDEGNVCHQGDQVEIIASRPLSKTKRWRVTKVLNKATA
jgi:small subunit ribosomal protein S17